MWIDTDGLREIGATLRTVREALVPPPLSSDPPSAGPLVVTAACARFASQLEQARLLVAREVDGVALATVAAAQHWERAEHALGRRVPL